MNIPEDGSDEGDSSVNAQEHHWEPELPVHAELPPDIFLHTDDLENEDQGPQAVAEAFSAEERRDMEEALRQPAKIMRFPVQTAGAPVPNRRAGIAGYQKYARAFSRRNPWAPFTSHIDWAVARWAKLRGPGSTAFTELLKIEGVGYLSYLPMSDSCSCRCLKL